ncbi:MAG: heat-shock protein Hsp90 [Selenomonadaceae bacterium]|nr:heat-shock protein Hsp90 [Selenomonadaceae bacterium]
MDKQTLIEKLKNMTASPSCCEVVKQAVKVYLASLAVERIAVDNLIAALEDNLVEVDEMLATAHSDDAVKYFGVEGAKAFVANAEALKAAGEKYCNCLACSVAREVLDHKELLRS